MLCSEEITLKESQKVLMVQISKYRIRDRNIMKSAFFAKTIDLFQIIISRYKYEIVENEFASYHRFHFADSYWESGVPMV